MMPKRLAALLLPLLLAPAASAVEGGGKGGFPGLPASRRPRVEIAWNRLYDLSDLYALFDRLEATWPNLLRHEVIGRSFEGRELRVYTLTNPKTGADSEKPAMWIDGNVHGNEVQGSEAVLYAAWYLLENYGHVDRVTELVDGSAFYLLPTQNPDGRESWFRDAHNASSSRSGRMPLDDDGDGLFDEDPTNDLDGDGEILQMRKHVPGEGTHRLDPDDPRVLEAVPPNDKGLRGDWLLLGQEGIDDDGDGRMNEDGAGFYDMNRAWPSFWMPDHVQFGAGPYPLFWPEARAIAKFLLEHPNVAALQSFHNAGGMILRGPGAESFGEYAAEDVRVFDEIGKDGEKMLPFYRYMTIWKDLYTVFGGFATWGYEGLGIISFTNEMWSDDQMFPAKGTPNADFKKGGRESDLYFDDALLMGAGYVEWHPFDHPLYGRVEIGGFRKDVGRVPPTFLIEEMVHRNALFTLKHAEAMPRVAVTSATVTGLGGGLSAIDVTFRNSRAIPTRTARAAQMKIGSPDVFEITPAGAGLEVLAGGIRSDRFRPERIDLAEREPARLLSERGLGGRAEATVRWFVRGKGEATITFRGEKFRAVGTTVSVE